MILNADALKINPHLPKLPAYDACNLNTRYELYFLNTETTAHSRLKTDYMFHKTTMFSEYNKCIHAKHTSKPS